ncbi:MAG TPA: hypothetical protein VLH16_06940, partial [Bacteroidales bacterium]|nr:hypothetical protein [Bacteroidales bacterium]
AFVVLKPGEQATVEEIMDYCSGQLARFKQPRSIEIKEALPKVMSGKVLKKELRENYTDDRELHGGTLK